MITAKEKLAAKHGRINNYENRKTILDLEKAWGKYAFRRLENEDLASCKLLKHSALIGLINKKANKYLKAWKKNSRLSGDDFISVLYEKAWEIIADYSWYNDYFLYEYLNKSMENACIDLLKSQGLTKDREHHLNRPFHEAVSLISCEDLYSLENKILLSHSVQELVSKLDPVELRVFNLYLNADNIEQVTLTMICQELNLEWPQQAKRIKEGIKEKFASLV